MKKFLIITFFLSLATPSIARPFIDVTRALLAVIPESEEAIRSELIQLIQIENLFNKGFSRDWEHNFTPERNKYINDLLWKAPELRIRILWHDLIICFQKYYPNKYNLNQWQQTAAEILMGTLEYQDFL